jgi:ATP-dependent helicase/nuclease subunit A
LVHGLLEQWDFQQNSENFRDPLREFCRQALRGDLDDDEKNAVILDIEKLMETFLHSPPYRELQQATVIGREVPFVMPWSNEEDGSGSHPCLMEGVMDVVYEVAGNVWVGDYKTDMVTASNVVEYAEVYRQQAQVYAIAASRSLGVEVKGCQLFFLRIGDSVSIMSDIAKFS